MSHFICPITQEIMTDPVTLGHNKKDRVSEHDYLGSDKIIEDLSKAPGWDDGLVQLRGLRRDTIGAHAILI
jgi:hypothetical protein